MKRITRWLIAGLVFALTACGGGLLGNQGRIRLVNATTGLGALDLLIDNSAAITGVPTAAFATTATSPRASASAPAW